MQTVQWPRTEKYYINSCGKKAYNVDLNSAKCRHTANYKSVKYPLIKFQIFHPARLLGPPRLLGSSEIVSAFFLTLTKYKVKHFMRSPKTIENVESEKNPDEPFWVKLYWSPKLCK